MSPNTRKGRVRQQRTVYSVEQREELERFFHNSHYPSYEEREALAARLSLQEQQVQVWFKNRRAKYRKSQEATQQPGGAAEASSQDPGDAVPGPEPMPAPPAAGPVFTENLEFTSSPGFHGSSLAPGFSGVAFSPGYFGANSPRGFSGEVKGPGFSGDATVPGGSASAEGPGFHSPPPPYVFGGVVATEASTSSYSQVQWDPTQDAQNPVPAAAPTTAEAAAADPAPDAAADAAPDAAPVWFEDPCVSGFDSDLYEGPTLADILASRGPLQGPSSSQSGCPKDEDSGSGDDSGPQLLDL